MKTNLQELTKQYAKLVAKENEIKSQKSELSLQIKEQLKKMGSTSFGTKDGVFSLYRLTSWIYSKKVTTKVAELEALKEKEKEAGIAKPNYTETLRFNSR